MSEQMTKDQFDQIMKKLDRIDVIETRLDTIEDNMVRKSDVFQSVLTVQGFTFAIIVGVIVILNALVGFS